MNLRTILLLIAFAYAMHGDLFAANHEIPGGYYQRRQESRYGPKRNDPSQGIPKHAYSPFDDIDKPEPPKAIAGRDFIAGRVLIKLKPDVGVSRSETGFVVDDAALNAVLEILGIESLESVIPHTPHQNLKMVTPALQKIGKPNLLYWFKGELGEGVAVMDAVDQLKALPLVDYAEPDYIRKLAGQTTEQAQIASIPDAQSDPKHADQWHLAAVKAPEAWAYLESQGLPPGGSRDIVVAVIDTGVDYEHPDLASNIWTNSREIPGNNIDDDENGYVDDVHGIVAINNSGNPIDDNGHGTHVAGIVAAQANNGIGGVGIAFNSQIMPIKAAQYSGFLATSDIAESIHYAVIHGADVINMSFSGSHRSLLEEDALAIAFGQTVLVAAAGNDGRPNESACLGFPMYPAAYNWVLGVMASNPTPDEDGNWLTSFSNWDCIPKNVIEYELMAPGVDVWSTFPNEQYAEWDGTSMSAPIVSGIAALLRTEFNDRDVYSSRFIMGQIVANASPIVDAVSALTVTPKPELTYLEHWLFDTAEQNEVNDADGIVDSGETIDLAIVIRNHWGKADPVNVTLDAWAEGAFQADPYVTMITGAVDYGAVGSFNRDDNGLIYDAEGAITGVRNPFRFTISADCPNDHVIPFRLTMTTKSGLNPGDSTEYTFKDRFYLTAHRGRELPRIISEDMELTKDFFWIVTDESLIERGVTVTISEGTQLQFGVDHPAGVYQEALNPLIQVEGSLRAMGTFDAPVELFQQDLFSEKSVKIFNEGDFASTALSYCRVRNPSLGLRNQGTIDHCLFSQDSAKFFPGVAADSISNSRFVRLGKEQGGASVFGLSGSAVVTRNLFDFCQLGLSNPYEPRSIPTSKYFHNVFLGNYKTVNSVAHNIGKTHWTQYIAEPVFPVEFNGSTYFSISTWNVFGLATAFAQFIGGNLVSIGNDSENSFLTAYRDQYLTEAVFSDEYTHFPWVVFEGNPKIGLSMDESSSSLIWSSGESVTYSNWSAESPNFTESKRYVELLSSGLWNPVVDNCGPSCGSISNGPYILEVPGTWTLAELKSARREFISNLPIESPFRDNAILNRWFDPDPEHWMRFYVQGIYFAARDTANYINNNYWGTQSRSLIDAAIHDFHDEFNLPTVYYEPVLEIAPGDTFPFVVDIRLSQYDQDVSAVGVGTAKFSVSFNREMNNLVQPLVSFGPDAPVTDFTVHPVNGGWQDSKTWLGLFKITPLTGDGYQLIRVARAVAADDPWLVAGDDTGRFRFEIITSGTEAMNLQANAGEGSIDLSWQQDDFDLLAGFRVYRSVKPENNFQRINSVSIPSEQRSFTDSNLEPGRPYYYKFTVVKTDLTESDFSNVATATPLDTILPVLNHTTTTTASPGLSLTLFADATDNVSVEGVTLYFREIGAESFISRSMTSTTGDRYAATIEGSHMNSPGVEYYIEATDGVSVTRVGRAESPNQILVEDKPVVTSVSPNRGPTSGGTSVAVGGANFKTGATVTFNGSVAANAVVVTTSQITCTSPVHFASVVDVVVKNPDSQVGRLLRAFTFESDVVSVSLPDTGGGQSKIVEVPLNVSNLNGLVAASFTISFDGNIIHALSARTGTLTPGWSLVANTSTTGQSRISMASNGGTVSGTGTLVIVEFEISGAPDSTSQLSLSNLLFNDGAIQVEASPGSFSVNAVFDVSGSIRYWNGSMAVPGVSMTLRGERIYSGESVADGGFSVAGAATGDYTLTPSKSDSVQGISAFDASLALQHDAGLITLSGMAATAADVNKSGAITSFDAFLILQKSVDLITLPFSGAGVVWDFNPQTRTYSNLNSHQTGQDFTAILLGDASGNWGQSSGQQVQGIQQVGATSLTEPEPAVVGWKRQTSPQDPDESKLWLLINSGESRIYSAEVTLGFGQNQINSQSIQPGPSTKTFLSAVNQGEDGIVRAAMSGAAPFSGIGTLLVSNIDGDPDAEVQIINVSLNEGRIPVRVDSNGAAFDRDTDDDGHSDWEEVLAGTDPTDKRSSMSIKEIRSNPDGTRTIVWDSVPGKRYQLQYKNSVSEREWTDSKTETANEDTISVTDENTDAASHRIYRIRLAE